MTGAEVKQIRNKLGLSQKAMAGLIGCKWRTLQNWECETTKVPGKAERLLVGVDRFPEFVKVLENF
ncbi:MAG: hypothetical protein KJ630_19005 [Proteobacteria bacterium]|nr:hypothetical protein [Pseudomonadota bacterium]